MSQKIDVRGLSCPQPVLATLSVLRKLSKGEVKVVVDTVTSKENIIRAAAGQGWEVTKIAELDGDFHITIVK